MIRKHLISTGCIWAALIGLSGGNAYGEVVINRPLDAPQTPTQRFSQEQEGNVYSLPQAYENYQTKSYSEAYKEFDHLAKQQDPKALMAAGYLLAAGMLPRDFATAQAYLAKAASLKYARAIYLQGLLAIYRNNDRPNTEAERLINQAAALGDYVAANSLANYHFQKGNYALAQRWNEKAVNLGSPAARQNQRTIFNVNTHSSTPMVPKEAFNPPNTGVIGELRQRSAEGNAAASYDLAIRYHKGIGVAVNFGEAIRLYQLAAKQGSAEARKVLPILLSKRSSGGDLNSMWMQEMSNMMPNPVVVQTPSHKPSEGNLAERATELGREVSTISPLQEDDPLDGLLQLTPTP